VVAAYKTAGTPTVAHPSLSSCDCGASALRVRYFLHFFIKFRNSLEILEISLEILENSLGNIRNIGK
jgi:hypothetical protein